MEIYRLPKRERRILFDFLTEKTGDKNIDDKNFKRDLLVFNVRDKEVLWRVYIHLYRLNKEKLSELRKKLAYMPHDQSFDNTCGRLRTKKLSILLPKGRNEFHHSVKLHVKEK